jgi:hypothetical protein
LARRHCPKAVQLAQSRLVIAADSARVITSGRIMVPELVLEGKVGSGDLAKAPEPTR